MLYCSALHAAAYLANYGTNHSHYNAYNGRNARHRAIFEKHPSSNWATNQNYQSAIAKNM